MTQDNIDRRTLVVLATYNEIENIPSLVTELLATLPNADVLIVDDNSPDGTGRYAQELAAREPRVKAFVRENERGLGSAVLRAFQYAIEYEYDYVINMDADFSHSPTDLNRFLETAEDADLVLGSRYQDHRISVVNWDLRRLILSYGANVYTRIVTGLPISDATGGFKCFRREALQALNLDKMKSDGYCFQIETTFKIWKKGLRVKEIPIVFTDRTRGTSKMSGGIISEAFFLVLKLRLGLA